MNTRLLILPVLIAALVLGVSAGCKKDAFTTIPSFGATTITAKTTTTISCCSNLTNLNESAITYLGFCWSTSPYPTTNDFVEMLLVIAGLFTGTATYLLPNAVYYISAFPINASGTDYWEEINCKTMDTTAIPSYVPASGLVGWWQFNVYLIMDK